MAATHKDDYGRADDAMAQIARLRAQVESLMRDKMAQVVDGTERIEAAAYEAADVVRERADAVAGTVRERPLTAVLIAAAVGYLVGRMVR
jgi:ElaB/YqjD/DUF883 family membrane-anchored ribosome-binding protein